MISISQNIQSSIANISKNSLSGSERGASPLDLFNGHLRTNNEFDDTIPFHALHHVPLLHNSRPVDSWLQPVDIDYQWNPFVLKVQPFVAGGYEATITKVDIEKVGRALDGGTFGKREKKERTEQNENDVVSSKNRAKIKVRHLIKSMGCDRMLTLTVRQNIDNQWTVEQWAKNWKKFIRLLAKAGVDLCYVAVLEKHKSGYFHLHAAILGKVSVNLLRGIWHAVCGGRGMGNVDISFRRGVTDHERRAGLAKYVSKYITKQDNAEFNKKRYWSSRHNLPAGVRYVLTAGSIRSALAEVSVILGLKNEVLQKVFIFKNDIGSWFQFREDMALPVPF